MNADNHPDPIDPLSHTNPIESPRRSPWSWVRRFLWRNPFYLASAALFLFGINQLSVDPDFLGAEQPKLLFNFAALQTYEILLVALAIFLALRRIWYDSTLLVVLESGLVLVQFILVTHAALISRGTAWAVCLTGTALAVGRFGGMRRFIPTLNLPAGLLAWGAVVLLANFSLPFFYRWTLEEATPDWDDWSTTAWLLGLPALQLFANLLPRTGHDRLLESQRPWLPFLMFHLWIAATAIHLRCMDYFTPLPFHPYLAAPVLWTAAWTAYHRATDFVPVPSPQARARLLMLPLFSTLLAIGANEIPLFFLLNLLNAGGFLGLAVLRRDRRVSAELLLMAGAACLAGVPENWVSNLPVLFSRERCVAVAVTGYALVRLLFTRRPDGAILGGLAAAIAPCFVGIQAFDLPLQTGLLYVLVHSLWWDDRRHTGAAAFRIVTAVVWATHSAGWAFGSLGTSARVVIPGAVLLLACYTWVWLRRGKRGPLILPAAVLLSLLSSPCRWGWDKLKVTPPGLLAVLASLVLLAAGTALALAKPRWSEANTASPRNEG